MVALETQNQSSILKISSSIFSRYQSRSQQIPPKHFVAEYLLEGYNIDSIQMPHYGFSRDNQGNLTITRENAPSSDVRSTQDLTQNPSGYVVLRTDSGPITELHMTPQDKENFVQVACYTQEHPIDREAQIMVTVGRERS